MADGWVRAVATNVNNYGYFGNVPIIGVAAGQTVLRAWWNIGLFYLAADVTVYPPGSSILRAGLAYDVADLGPFETPTPIGNADADWMAITTINPYGVQLSRATNVAWQLNWGFITDQSIKSQRRNDTLDPYTMYLSWEMALEDEISGFTMSGWWCSLDAYIRTPD